MTNGHTIVLGGGQREAEEHRVHFWQSLQSIEQQVLYVKHFRTLSLFFFLSFSLAGEEENSRQPEPSDWKLK